MPYSKHTVKRPISNSCSTNTTQLLSLPVPTTTETYFSRCFLGTFYHLVSPAEESITTLSASLCKQDLRKQLFQRQLEDSFLGVNHQDSPQPRSSEEVAAAPAPGPAFLWQSAAPAGGPEHSHPWLPGQAAQHAWQRPDRPRQGRGQAHSISRVRCCSLRRQKQSLPGSTLSHSFVPSCT